MTAQQFWQHTDRPATSGCWLWKGAKGRAGYANLRFDGRYLNGHRLAWILCEGEIPKGLYVCHRCDVPACINPAHLFLGTAFENMGDAQSKGRLSTGDHHYSHLYPERVASRERSGARKHPERRPRGERHGHARLTAATVLDIRARYAQGDSKATLAAHFGLHSGHVHKIVTRVLWTHV